jgi:ElaB/YqjD/DUF883 family membrane-anchored ribosome-binding protein
MNNDQFEGSVRSTVGQGEKAFGRVANDSALAHKGAADTVAGKAQSALGSAKDALSSGADAVASIDTKELRDDIAKLTQSVTDLVQKQASSTRDQLAGAVNAAGDNLTQAASAAQDKFVSIEADMEGRIKSNPWMAVGIAAFIGILIGKMT